MRLRVHMCWLEWSLNCDPRPNHGWRVLTIPTASVCCSECLISFWSSFSKSFEVLQACTAHLNRYQSVLVAMETWRVATTNRCSIQWGVKWSSLTTQCIEVHQLLSENSSLTSLSPPKPPAWLPGLTSTSVPPLSDNIQHLTLLYSGYPDLRNADC